MADETTTANDTGPEIDIEAIVAKHSIIVQDEAKAEDQPQETEAAEPPKEEEAKPPQEEPLRARQLAAIARREKELKAKEAELEKKLEERLQQKVQELQSKLTLDPAAYLTELGVKSPGGLANQLVAAELGEDAPVETRLKAMEARYQAQLAALQKQIESQREEAMSASQRASLEARANAAEKEIESFVKSPPEDLRFVHTLASDDAEEAQMLIARTMADVVNKRGVWPSVQEVAKAINEQMERDWLRFQPKSVTAEQTTQATTEGKTRQSPKTLSNADTATRPAPEPEGLLSAEEYQRRGIAVLQKHGFQTKH